MRPIAMAAIGSATTATASSSAPLSMRSVGRQPYSVATFGSFQKPLSLQRWGAESTAVNRAPTPPMPRPAATSSFTPASCSARSTPA